MSLSEQYTAIREGAAVGAVAATRQLAVAGSERATYLQGLLTNDIPALLPGTGCYSAWLTPQGRMLTDMDVLESGDMILLDLPAGEADATLARLDQFLFSEDVQLSALDGSLSAVRLHGPAAAGIVDRAVAGIDAASWSNYQLAKGRFQEGPVVVARIDQLGVPGYSIYLEPAREASLRAALSEAGAIDAGREAIDAARIEAGFPVFGLDMTTDTIPLEAGIEQRAISFSKGCYVGQEVIIRVLHRGHGRVARKLVALRLDAEGATAGARLFAGDKDIGWITSAAVSPSVGPIALGYVHRDFLEAGTRVVVGAGERPVGAVVSALPLRA
jgi:folate-binding protein YgfZ